MSTEVPWFVKHAHPIERNGENFEVFLTWGTQEMVQLGWALISCSGLPCSYSTRSKEAVRASVALGFRITHEAQDALDNPTIMDDPAWAVEKECERARKNDQRELEREAYNKRRDELVASAKAKLTAEEFDAVQDEARDP